MRKATIKHHVKRCFPVRHWGKCCSCASYFKWEFGWKIYKSYHIPYLYHVHREDAIYLCRSCARTKKMADNFFTYMSSLSRTKKKREEREGKSRTDNEKKTYSCSYDGIKK